MQRVTFIYLGILFQLFVTDLVANDKQAVDFFEQGEQYFKAKDYTSAKSFYEKAINERSEEGSFNLKSKKSSNYIPYGRGFQEIEQYDENWVEYIPNQRLATIRSDENKNRVAAKKENPPKFQISSFLQDSGNNNVLEAGETAYLEIRIKNTGLGTANSATLQLMNNNPGLEIEDSVYIGDLESNQAVVKKLKIKTDRKIKNGNANISFWIKENDGFGSERLTKSIATQGFMPPNLVISEVKITDQNGDGKIAPVELINIMYRIKNIGWGSAHNVVAIVDAPDNIYFSDEDLKKIQIGTVKPNEQKVMNFAFYTDKSIKENQNIPITIKINESEGKFGSKQPLALKMGSAFSANTKFAATANPVPLTPGPVIKSDVDLNIPIGSISRPDAVAVVIGNTDYHVSGVPKVDFAINDARTVRNYLIKTMGFRDTNIIYVENATSAKFNEIFGKDRNNTGKLHDYVKKGISEVFIYYSGHGAPDVDGKSAYFVPVDADPNYISNGGYSLSTFYANIDTLQAKDAVVVIDSCFSGNSESGFLLKNISPAMVVYDLPNAKSSTNAIVMTSAGKEEVSSWYPEKGHSLYTYYYLKALGGQADTNGDKKITPNEINNYLADKVTHMARRLNHKNQHPTLSQESDKVLVAF